MWFRVIRNVTTAVLLAASTANASWTQFQGNAQHTGYSDSLIDASALEPAWSISTGLSVSIQQGSAAIVDGDVYATTYTPGPFGTYPLYHVSRYDGATGDLRWSTPIEEPSPKGVSPPTVGTDRVYVHHYGSTAYEGPRNPSNENPALVGLDRSTGALRSWTSHSGQLNSGSRPTVEGDAVFAAGGYFGGLDSYELNGTHRWFHKVNQQYEWVPAADTDDVYVFMGEGSGLPGPSTGTLYVVDRVTGERSKTIYHPRSVGSFFLQSVTLGGREDAYAVTEIDNSLFGHRRTLVRFDLEAEGIAWEVDGEFSGNPAIAGGRIYIPDDTELRVLDQDTGETLWTWYGVRDVDGPVALTDRYAFVNAWGSVHAIDLVSHTSVWSSEGIAGSISIDGELLVISNSYGIFAYTAPVPEPSSAALLCLGAATLVFANRRQRG